jgi:hypothetical protein
MVKENAVVDFIRSIPDNKRHLCLIYVSMHPTQIAFDINKIMIALHELKQLGSIFACSLVQTPDNMRLAKEMNLQARVEEAGAKWFGSIPADTPADGW